MRFRTIIQAALGSLLMVSHSDEAHACGGCFHPPTQSGTVITDHRMIFVVSPLESTLYDEIMYSGSPADFAWVLPVHGPVTVGLSSDAVFSALEQATQTSIVSPELPPCPVDNCPCRAANRDASIALPDGAAVRGIADGSVTVVSQKTIGPYATVQLKSTDPNALSSWLTANGYDIPSDVQPVIAAYVEEGFDFLALKLAPGQGVQAMRPVRVTTPGSGLSLPLRMVAAGTGAIVGITLWIIADGSYEPKNFHFFTISPSELTWDWSINRSNYTTVRTQKEAAFNNAAWQIESSLGVSAYTIEGAVMRSPNDYVPLPSDDGGSSVTGDDGGSELTPAQAQLEDLSVLFPEGNIPMRMTRMRSDLAHAALAEDLVIQAAADQTVISNVYQVTQSVNAPKCPIPAPCYCGPGQSNGSSGAQGAGGSSGSAVTGATASDSGVPPNEPPPDRHIGCAATSSEPGSAAVDFFAAGFVGMALLRMRRGRRSVSLTGNDRP